MLAWDHTYCNKGLESYPPTSSPYPYCFSPLQLGLPPAYILTSLPVLSRSTLAHASSGTSFFPCPPRTLGSRDCFSQTVDTTGPDSPPGAELEHRIDFPSHWALDWVPLVALEVGTLPYSVHRKPPVWLTPLLFQESWDPKLKETQLKAPFPTSKPLSSAHGCFHLQALRRQAWWRGTVVKALSLVTAGGWGRGSLAWPTPSDLVTHSDCSNLCPKLRVLQVET